MDWVNILPPHLKNTIKDYLWGNNLNWKYQFSQLLDNSHVTKLNHIGSLYSDNFLKGKFKDSRLFNTTNYESGYILQFLRATSYQRRTATEYEIEDEVFCYLCGEKTVFPFTLFNCHDCEKYNTVR